MQERSKEQSSANGRNRPKKILNGNAILFHNAHVKNGQQRDPRCGYCQSGVAAVVRTVTSGIPEPVEEGGLAESNRSDAEGDASSPFTGELWQT